MPIFIIFALIIAFLAISFALQNNTVVTVNLLTWQLRESLALVILSSLAVGVVIGLLVLTPTIVRRSWRKSRVERMAKGLEAEVQTKEQAISAQAQKVESVRQHYRDLLQALGVLDAVTALLHTRVLSQSLTHVLTQGAADPAAHCLLMLEVEQATSADGQALPVNYPALRLAIANLLQQAQRENNWLYSDEQGRFAALLTNVTLKDAGRFGDALQAQITSQPLALNDGGVAQVQMSMGGVLTVPNLPVDAHTLMEEAKRALQQARERGRNRFRLNQLGQISQ